MKTIYAKDINFAEILKPLEVNPEVKKTVEDIIAQVRKHKDSALSYYTRHFDKIDTYPPFSFRIPKYELESIYKKCFEGDYHDEIIALQLAHKRITSFHGRNLSSLETLDYVDDDGVRLGYRWTPIQAVGMYVPGGTASYPSSVLMNAIPAKLAGVKRLVMTVPTPDNKANPLVWAAAHLCDVDEVYSIGGAQAIAALAYGTETIKPVDKIVGPGNAYVAEAKRQVFGVVGIDMIAGPSEILIVADKTANPKWVAADFLSQAEHDKNARSIIITDDVIFARSVNTALAEQISLLSRYDIVRASCEEHGLIIIVNKLSDAVDIINKIAPEHLELCCDNPYELLKTVVNAGSIFIGQNTPEAIGDYIAGPNHVLPTGGSARFSSGLSVMDFMKRSTFIECSPDALKNIGQPAITLANCEGLGAHAKSIAIRLEK